MFLYEKAKSPQDYCLFYSIYSSNCNVERVFSYHNIPFPDVIYGSAEPPLSSNVIANGVSFDYIRHPITFPGSESEKLRCESSIKFLILTGSIPVDVLVMPRVQRQSPRGV